MSPGGVSTPLETKGRDQSEMLKSIFKETHD